MTCARGTSTHELVQHVPALAEPAFPGPSRWISRWIPSKNTGRVLVFAAALIVVIAAASVPPM
ncbi:hypothetical protein [Streptomyces sp. NPDC001221]